MCRDVECAAALVGRGDELVFKCLALDRVGDGFDLLAVTETHRTFKTHSAEFTGRPRKGGVATVQRATGHGLCAEPVALAQHHGHPRNGDAAGDDEHAAEMSDLRRLLCLGSHHESGCVAQRHDGQIVCVAELHEPRRLVGRLTIDGATEMRGIVCDDADRMSTNSTECGDDSDTEVAA